MDNVENEEMLLRIFASEIVQQVNYAERAAIEIDVSINDLTSSRDQDGLWYHLESFMTAAVSVANILWPSNGAKSAVKSRASKLRTSFGIDEEIAPAVRTTRNSLVHFDERIDSWWSNSKAKNFADRNIGPVGSIVGIDASDFARYYDPTTTTFSVYQSSVVLSEAMSLLHDVKTKVTLFIDRQDGSSFR